MSMGRTSGGGYIPFLPYPSLAALRLFMGEERQSPARRARSGWIQFRRRKKMRCLVVSGRLRLLLASAALLVLGVMGVGPAHAQVLYGTLVGEVTDSSKAGVP